MIIVSERQQAALDGAVRTAFEREMVEHLHDFAPKHCEVIKDAGVREVVALGLERAAAFGFTHRGPVRLFLELMFMFGSEFATDPQHAWAAPSLAEAMPGDQMFRAESLYTATQAYLQAVSGPGHCYAVAALRRTRTLMSADLRRYDFSPERLASSLAAILHEVYPEKTRYLGEEGMLGVLRSGLALAQRHAVTQPRNRAVFVFLVFVLGHGVADDPLYPWIRSALTDSRIPDPDARAARVESRAGVYLDRVIDYVRDM